MNIGIISSEPIGWSETPLYGHFQKIQANILRQKGHNITLISPQPRSLKFGLNFKRNNYNETNIKLYYNSFWNVFRILPKLETIFYCISGILIFLKNYQEIKKIEIFHFHNIYNAGVLMYVLKKLKLIENKKIIITEHTSFVHNGGGSSFIKKKILNTKGVRISSVSDSINLELLNFTKTSYIINNPVDFVFEKLDENLIKTNQVCIIGALEKIKNHQLLFNSLKNTDLNINLIIVGDGSLRNKLLLESKKLPKNIRVKFTGTKNKFEIKTILSSSALLVSVSKSETFGVVLIESISQGTPVISTKNGGCNDIINNENGFICEFDEKEICNKIEYILTKNPFERKNIRKSFQEKFSNNSYLKKLYELYGI